MFLIEGSKLELKQEDAFNARPIYLVFFGKYTTYLLKLRQIMIIMFFSEMGKNIVKNIG